MAASGPPDGWRVITGTWGTDVDRDESVVYTGAAALKFMNTAVATKVASPGFTIAGGMDSITDTAYYHFRAWCYSDSTSVSITIGYSYDGGDTGSTLITVTPPSANKWFLISEQLQFVHGGPPTALVARVTIAKDTTVANVWIDQVTVHRAAPYVMFTDASGVALTADSAWHDVYFSNDPAIDNQEVEQDGRTLRVKYTGMYAVTATIRSDADIDAGKIMSIRLYVNDVNASVIRTWEGTQATGVSRTATVTAIMPLRYNTEITVQGWSNNGSNITFATDDVSGSTTNYFNHFTAVCVGRY